MQRRRLTRLRAEAEPQPTTGQQQQQELDNPESEAARTKAEADRLRAAERFMMVGTGEAECKGAAAACCWSQPGQTPPAHPAMLSNDRLLHAAGCAYVYNPKKGDPEYPVAPGTAFNVGTWGRAAAGGVGPVPPPQHSTPVWPSCLPTSALLATINTHALSPALPCSNCRRTGSVRCAAPTSPCLSRGRRRWRALWRTRATASAPTR